MNSWSNWSSSELWESAHHEDDFHVFTEIFKVEDKDQFPCGESS